MIEAENLVKRYGPFEAVKGVSFRIDQGQVVGLLGPNGAGKTSIMRILTCYLPATSGRVTIAGHEVEMPFVRTFSDVPLKQPLLFIDSRGRASFALNQASFAAAYGIDPPQPVFIPRKGH